MTAHEAAISDKHDHQPKIRAHYDEFLLELSSFAERATTIVESAESIGYAP